MNDVQWLRAAVHGVIAAVHVQPGQRVGADEVLLVQEAMKVEVPLSLPQAAQVLTVNARVGEVVQQDDALLQWRPVANAVEALPSQVPPAEPAAPTVHAAQASVGAPVDSFSGSFVDSISGSSVDLSVGAPVTRASLRALQSRLALLQDSARPDVLARRHAAGRMTAREQVATLLDSGSFSEYGALAIAAQRSRRGVADLQALTPADGLITCTGTVGGQPVAVLAYDYTVLAGTQGVFNHRKSDRLLAQAASQRWPVILFAEGGGGRPGDVDWLGVAGLDCTTFSRFAALSGVVPLLGVVGGRCFAGNAALLGCCDVIIATEGSSLGLGGPAMIEGGGLGVVAADAVGPVADLAVAGVIDMRVPDDAAAVALARRVLALLLNQPLQPRLVGDVGASGVAGGVASGVAGGVASGVAGGVVGAGTESDRDALASARAALLRDAIPERRNTVFDPRRIVAALVDADSLIELRPEFGRSVITALATLGGRTVALAASRPMHLGGALDAPSCDKLARFMQLADAHGLPLVTLVDTPGFMVGPASEKTAMVRHAARLFVTAAKLRVPVLSVVLRRGYGLGAMALTAGHFHAPVATCAWPSAEFGPMGLEGAVRLGFRKELEAAPEAEREALFQSLLAQALAKGQALNMASFLEIDEVIDPAETRAWLLRHLSVVGAQPLPPRRPFIDPW